VGKVFAFQLPESVNDVPAPPVNVFVVCALADDVVIASNSAQAIDVARTNGSLFHEVMETRNLKRGCIIVVPIRLMSPRSARCSRKKVVATRREHARRNSRRLMKRSETQSSSDNRPQVPAHC
jgi:hypothetical protein